MMVWCFFVVCVGVGWCFFFDPLRFSLLLDSFGSLCGPLRFVCFQGCLSTRVCVGWQNGPKWPVALVKMSRTFDVKVVIFGAHGVEFGVAIHPWLVHSCDLQRPPRDAFGCQVIPTSLKPTPTLGKTSIIPVDYKISKYILSFRLFNHRLLAKMSFGLRIQNYIDYIAGFLVLINSFALMCLGFGNSLSGQAGRVVCCILWCSSPLKIDLIGVHETSNF